MREDTDDFRQLFLRDVPLLDVRAPVEFSKGAFPRSLNLPLMNDAEREAVGTCYKQRGQQAAIALGHQLVSGDIQRDRVVAWAEFAQAHPDGFLYCFRGGLRSQISQQWLEAELGWRFPRVRGGYKAMRTYLLDHLRGVVQDGRWTVLGGLTGTGKTELLHLLPNGVDLEGHANHRGSSFGRQATPQPSQINFENALSIDLLKRQEHGATTWVVEDESRYVGSCFVPHELQHAMALAPVVWLDDPFEARVDRILRDYVVDLSAGFVALHGHEAGWRLFTEHLLGSLGRIAKRLGGERLGRARSTMVAALAEQERTGAVDLHRGWIVILLREYYDPMYAFQRESKKERIVFSGGRQAVVEYLLQARSEVQA